MENNITELVFILDKSGSMAGLESDTIGGFNSMLEKQKQAQGKVYVSTVLFSNDPVVLHDRVDIEKVEPMTADTYQVGGCTALLDALGGAIHHIKNIHRYARTEDVPEHTIFVITTDGLENCSHRYTAEKVREMIRHEEEKYGWEFLFLAANIDAVETASHYGIRAERSANYRATKEDLKVMYDCVSDAVMSKRLYKSIQPDWSAPLDEDKK